METRLPEDLIGNRRGVDEDVDVTIEPVGRIASHLAPSHELWTTLFFTDLQGSTALWRSNAKAMGRALAALSFVLHHLVDHFQGIVFKTAGEAVLTGLFHRHRRPEVRDHGRRLLEASGWGPSQLLIGFLTARGHPRRLCVRPQPRLFQPGGTLRLASGGSRPIAADPGDRSLACRLESRRAAPTVLRGTPRRGSAAFRTGGGGLPGGTCPVRGGVNPRAGRSRSVDHHCRGPDLMRLHAAYGVVYLPDPDSG